MSNNLQPGDLVYLPASSLPHDWTLSSQHGIILDQFPDGYGGVLYTVLIDDQRWFFSEKELWKFQRSHDETAL